MTLAIGGCTVAELQSRMGQSEFMDWIAYYAVEPFGGVRGDVQTAILASLIANANRNPKKQPRAFKPAQFLPDWWKSAAGGRAGEAEGPDHVARLLAKFQMLTGSAPEPQAEPETGTRVTDGSDLRDTIG